jgi:hypothetical protein
MPFPDDDSLPLYPEALIGGEWRDLTDRLGDQPVTIRRGKSNGGRTAAAGRLTLTLDDNDGALTPKNPLSQWYPHIRKGVLVRLSYDRLVETFTGRTVIDDWGQSSDGKHQWALSGTASAFDVAAGVATIVGTATPRYATTGAYGGTIELLAKLSVNSVAGNPEFGLVAHYQDSLNTWRIAFATSGADIIKVHKLIGGNGVSWSASAGTLVAGTSYWVRAVVGRRIRVRFWADGGPEPSTWHLDVYDEDPFFYGRLPLVGSVGAFIQGTGTLTVDSITGDCWMAYGKVGGYAPRYLPRNGGVVDAVQRIEVGGILRQLGQGNKPLKSALWRENIAGGPVAMWPVNEGVDAPFAASALPGGQPMSVQCFDGTTGDPIALDWAPVEYNNWLEPIATPAVGVVLFLQGAVPMSSSALEWSGDFVFAIEADAGPFAAALAVWQGQGGPNRTEWIYGYLNGQWELTRRIRVDGVVTSDTLVSSGAVAFQDGRIHHARLTTVRAGGNVDWEIRLDNSVLASGTLVGSSWAPLGGVNGQSLASTSGRAAIGFLTAWDTATPPFNAANAAVVGRSGELAADRIARLCLEEGIPHETVGLPNTTEPMGPQPVATFLDIVRECEAVDGGVLYELRHDYGLGYLTREAMYLPNQPPPLVVDLATYQVTDDSAGVLTPTYDDQGLRNEIEVTRADGSTVRVLDQTSIDADGRYDEAVSDLNANNDAQLTGIANWLLNLGTVDEYRNPGLPLNLHANTGLIPAWLACDTGSRVQRSNPPRPHPPGTIDQLLDGSTQTLTPKTWTVSATCSPAAPWDVGTFSAATPETRTRYDSAYSTTSGAITTGTSTSLSVAVAAGRSLWVTGSTSPQFPFDIDLLGARVRVTAISGSSSPQTFTISTDVVNDINKIIPSGTPVRLWKPVRYGL